MEKVGIIFAIEKELLAFKKYLIIEKEYTIFNLTFYEEKVNAAKTTQILIDNIKVDYILIYGLLVV